MAAHGWVRQRLAAPRVPCVLTQCHWWNTEGVDSTAWVAIITGASTLVAGLGAQVLAFLAQRSRWRQERRASSEVECRQRYADLIVALDYWQSALDTFRADYESWVESNGDPEPDDDLVISKFEAHRDAARQALAIVDLITPSATVRARAREAVLAGEACNANLPSTADAGRFRARRAVLSNAMRGDLQLDPSGARLSSSLEVGSEPSATPPSAPGCWPGSGRRSTAPTSSAP